MNIKLQKKEPLVVGNDTFRCADEFLLTEFDLEIARTQIRETEERKSKCLKKMKEMLSKDLSVVSCTDNDFLLRYLRVAKFDCDKAFKALKKFYSVKKSHPDLFILSPQLKTLLDQNMIRRLPYKNEDGCFIFWIKLSNWNLQEMSFDNMIEVICSVFDILTMNPCLQVNGLIDIFDFQGFAANHAVQLMHPARLLLLSNLLQEIYPWRVNRVILINFPSWCQASYRVIRRFLKQKIADRIVFLGSDLNELHQHVNPVLLPKEYGGNIDENECSVTRLVMDNLHFIKYVRSYGQYKKDDT